MMEASTIAVSNSTRGTQSRNRSLPSGMWDRNGVYWSRFRQNGRLVRTRPGTDFRVARRAAIADAAPGGTVDLHSLRVSFITLAMNAGAKPKAVSLVVGHSRLTITLDVYTKASKADEREAVGVLPFATVNTPEHVLAMPSPAVHAPCTKVAKTPKTPRKQA